MRVRNKASCVGLANKKDISMLLNIFIRPVQILPNGPLWHYLSLSLWNRIQCKTLNYQIMRKSFLRLDKKSISAIESNSYNKTISAGRRQRFGLSTTTTTIRRRRRIRRDEDRKRFDVRVIWFFTSFIVSYFDEKIAWLGEKSFSENFASVVASVTRWLSYYQFNISPFRTMKICP